MKPVASDYFRRVVVFFLVVYATIQFGVYFVLQIWRLIPGLQDELALPILLAGAMLCALVVKFGLWYLGARGPQDAAATPLLSGPPDRPGARQALIGAGVVALAALVIWWLLIEGEIGRVPDTLNDEDHHMTAVLVIRDYLLGYLSLTGPTSIAPPGVVWRYPPLFPLLNALIASGHDAWFIRVFLMPWYVAAAVGLYTFGLWLFRSMAAAILCGLLVAANGLMLTATTVYFLDIGPACMMVLLSAGLAWSAWHHDRRIYLFTALIAGMAPQTRDHILFSSLFSGVFLASLYLVRQREKIARLTAEDWIGAGLLLALAALPGLLYTALKTSFNNIDASRLHLSNLPEQDYATFFIFLWVYMPPLVLAGVIWLIWWVVRRRPQRWLYGDHLVVGALWVCLGLQMALLFLFEPHWIPWSRNYLTFYGPLMVLGVLGIARLADVIRNRWPRLLLASPAATVPAVMAVAIGLELAVTLPEVHRDVIFNEPGSLIAYDQLFACMQKHPEELAGQTVYMQVPGGVPYGFNFAWRNEGWRIKDIIRTVTPVRWGDGYFRQLFAPLDEILRHVPPDWQFLMYHWREPRTWSPAIQAWYALKPTSLPPSSRILCEIVDPHSDGTKGVMLIQRLAAPPAHPLAP